MKILYVDDDKDSSSLMAKRLKQDGFQCEVFHSSEEAICHISPASHDAIILDIRLPGISGIELLKILRQKNIFTPAILITAFNSVEYSREALNSSANYLLEKPFTYNELRKILDSVLSRPLSISHCVERGLSHLNLTAREEEVARYILKGLSNAEIARLIPLSEKTVKQYVTQIFQKAGVSSRSEFFSSIFPV